METKLIVEPIGTVLKCPDTGDELTVDDTCVVMLRGDMHVTQKTYDALKVATLPV